MRVREMKLEIICEISCEIRWKSVGNQWEIERINLKTVVNSFVKSVGKQRVIGRIDRGNFDGIGDFGVEIICEFRWEFCKEGVRKF